ncbi:MAG: response regulator [Chloroflexota bacterium]|nr:response regulator [Chloroflexota bacterium]
MKTILVIEDDVAIGELVRIVLEEENHQVVWARNGREGLDQLARVRPDLVITDLMMPLLDGWALCHAMQEDPQYKQIPIVVLTAAPLASTAELPSHAVVLFKPFELDQLVEVVDRLLD